MLSAADAPTVPSTSGLFSRSAEITVSTTCTSLRIVFGKSGRSGRSVRRALRVASVLGRPSRRKNEPGILPMAYSFSSKSIVSGKKSVPGRGLRAIVAVASTIVSPSWMVTAPPASPAMRPVSSVTVLPPSSRVIVLISGMVKRNLRPCSGGAPRMPVRARRGSQWCAVWSRRGALHARCRGMARARLRRTARCGCVVVGRTYDANSVWPGVFPGSRRVLAHLRLSCAAARCCSLGRLCDPDTKRPPPGNPYLRRPSFARIAR